MSEGDMEKAIRKWAKEQTPKIILADDQVKKLVYELWDVVASNCPEGGCYANVWNKNCRD